MPWRKFAQNHRAPHTGRCKLPHQFHCGATALLTNDPDLARIPGIEVGVLDQLRP
jgi:hypothetical protein